MKKGFTLVELLGVIVILGIIATLTVPLIQRTIIEKNEEAYNLQIKSFEDAAKNWANDHIYELTCENTCVNPPLKTLTIEELQKEGFLDDGEISNPKGGKFNTQNYVTITKVDGKYKYTYDKNQD